MPSLNKVSLIGNIGSKEVRYTSDGKPIVNLTFATSEQWKDKNTGQQREKTDWHNVVIFGGLATVAEQYTNKGSKLYIEGKLQTRKWQDQSGQDRYTTEVVVQSFDHKLILLGDPNQNQQQAPQQQAPQQQAPQQQAPQQQVHQQQAHQQQAPQGGGVDFDDEIPF